MARRHLAPGICGHVTSLLQHGYRIVIPASLFPISRKFLRLSVIVAVWGADLVLNHLGFLKNLMEPVKEFTFRQLCSQWKQRRLWLTNFPDVLLSKGVVAPLNH